MIRSIATIEFYNNLVSARFLIGFLLCLVLIPFSIIIGLQEFQSRMDIYQVEKTEAEMSMNVTVYSALRPIVVKPPEPLSVFCRGITNNVGDRVRIYLGTLPLLAEGRTSVRDNPLLNTLFTLDFCSVMAIIMSLLAFVFSYDACSGEREQGTLKLMMSQSISRSKYLMGKITGVFLTLLPIIIFNYALSFIIVLVYPDISFSIGEWGRITVLFLMSIIYFTLFIALGVFISSRFRSSVTSIIICLFLWITLLYIIPSFSVYIARSFVTVQPRENLDMALKDIDRECEQKAQEYSNTLDASNVFDAFFAQYSLGYDGYREVKGTAKGTYEYHRQANEGIEPIRIDYADKKWQLQKSYLDELEHQRTFSEILASISPSEVFRLAASSLCRVDAISQNSFLEGTRRYREELITFFRDKKIFGSFLYFTPLSPEIFLETDDLLKVVTDGKIQSLDELYKWQEGRIDTQSIFTNDRPEWFEETPFIDVSNVPKFIWQPDTITDSIRKSIGKLGAMILITILLFYISFVSFTRYDVR